MQQKGRCETKRKSKTSILLPLYRRSCDRAVHFSFVGMVGHELSDGCLHSGQRLGEHIIGCQFAPSRGLRREQSRRIRLEPGADGLGERGVAPGCRQSQGLLEMLNGFIQLPLGGERNA